MFKILTLGMILVCLVLSAGLSACSPQEATQPETTIAPTEQTAYEGLGLTEEQIRSLEERGVANVDSVEVASKIAGFQVAVPSYVPEGYQTGKFMISISGAGLPQGMMKFNNTDVQIFYGIPGDRDAWIQFIQAPHKFGVGGGEPEPVELCGITGERVFAEADPVNGQEYARLSYCWEKNGIWYALTGTLTDTMNEEEMKKMACSIGSE